jgi:hypothetical protein
MKIRADDIFRFTTEDTQLINVALRVASKETQRPDLQKEYLELANIIDAELHKRRNQRQ